MKEIETKIFDEENLKTGFTEQEVFEMFGTLEMLERDKETTEDQEVAVAAAFTMRTTAPSTSDSRYYGTGNPYVAGGYGMPNCTTYAFGRFWEIAGSKPLFPLTRGYDATTVYWHCKNDSGSNYAGNVGQTAKLGAIACWSTIRNDNPTAGSSTGHVAIVERIESNGDIYCSNSAYQSTNFYMKTYSKASGFDFTSNGRTYYFQGFVYQKTDFGGGGTTTARYQAHDATYGWNPNVTLGTGEYAGNFGIAIDAIYLDTYRMRVHDKVTGAWLPWVQNRNDYAGNFGHAIDGVQIEGVSYRVHTKNSGWLGWVYKADSTSDGYAGIYGQEIDAIQINPL